MVKVVTNLWKILIGGYLTVEVILDLTYFFAVPKVIEEIRMVFDATVIRLNQSMWSQMNTIVIQELWVEGYH